MSDEPRIIELDIDSFRGQIYKYFKYKKLNVNDIEDLQQDVLCRMLESFTRFKGRSNISTLLYSICRNVIYEFYRKQKNLVELGDDIGTSNPLPELLFSIESEVDKLPQYLKVVYYKRFTLDMSLTDIAKDLSMPLGTVKYYVYLIKKAIRSSL